MKGKPYAIKRSGSGPTPFLSETLIIAAFLQELRLLEMLALYWISTCKRNHLHINLDRIQKFTLIALERTKIPRPVSRQCQRKKGDDFKPSPLNRALVLDKKLSEN